jgi:pimeloyl-ACP methyl ester carboxylesterase
MNKIHFLEAGTGFPVVFLHGFCESNKIWQNLMNELSEEFRILCPDLPGFGKSPALKNPFSLEQVGDELMHWLAEQQISESVIIGHSLGGYIALELLRKHKKSIAAIGLFNSSAFEDALDKKENRDKLIQFLHHNGVAPFIKTFVPSLFYPPTISNFQHIIDEIAGDGLSLETDVVAGYAAAMRDRKDSMELLRKYSDKILLIAGEHDQNVPLEKSKKMAAYLKTNNTYIMPESAHMSLFEQPKACTTAVRSFLQSVTF